VTHVADCETDPTKIAADATDMPLYIDLSLMPASFWSTVSNGGGDIRCFKPDGTELPREVVSCQSPYLDLDSTSKEVSLASAITSPSGGDWEIEVVFRKTRDDGTDEYILGTSTFGDYLYNRNNSGRITLRVSGVTLNFDFSPTINTSEQFNTLVMKNDASSGHNITCELNGQLASSPESGAGVRDLEDMDLIGSFGAGGIGADIARVRIWHDLTRTSLVHDYQVTNTTSGTLTDSGSAGNDGTITGATTVAGAGELHVKYTGTLSSSVATTIEIHADGTSSDYAVTATYGRDNANSGSNVLLRAESAVTDSTGNGNDATYAGTYSAGQIGQGLDAGQIGQGLDLSSDATIPDSATSDVSGFTAYKLSFWVKTTSTSSGAILVDKGGAAGFRVARNAATNNLDVIHASTTATLTGLWGSIDDGDWHYLSLRWNGTSVFGSVDGGSEVSTSQSTTPGANVTAYTLESSDLSGLDNFDLGDSALDANWITTEYNNQSSPSTFYTVTDPNAGHRSNRHPHVYRHSGAVIRH